MQFPLSRNTTRTHQSITFAPSSISCATFRPSRTFASYSTMTSTPIQSVIPTPIMPTILTIANLPPAMSSSAPTASSPSKVKSNPSLLYLQWKLNIWLSPTSQKKLYSSPNSYVRSKSIYLDQLSSTPTPSPRLITSRTTSNILARSTSMFVIILFAMPAPANMSSLEHVPAASQIADVLTKPLGPTKHAEALKMLKLFSFTLTN